MFLLTCTLFKSVGDFAVTAADNVMAGVATMEWQTWANKADGTKEMAASITLSQTAFGFTALVNDMLLGVQITQVYSGNVKVNSTTFGNLNALKLKLELNNAFKLGLGTINEHLAKMQIAVPSNIAGIFELHNLTLGYYDNYLYAGATPIFLPPAHYA